MSSPVRHLPTILAAAAVAAAMTMPTNACAGKRLRWAVMPGDQFKIEMNQTIKQKMTVMGNSVEIPQKMTMDLSWDVGAGEDAKVVHVGQTIDRIRMMMNLPNQEEIHFDSDAKEEPKGVVASQIASMMKPMVGKKMVQKMNVRGQVLDVTVPEGFFAGLKQNPAMKQMFSEDWIKELTTKVFPTFPVEEIEEGYQWTESLETNSPAGKMQIENSYTYAGEEQRAGRLLEKIDVTMELTFGDEANPLGARVKVKDQDNTGVIYFDAEAGHIAETTMTQKMVMEVSVAAQSFDQEMETTHHMVVKEK